MEKLFEFEELPFKDFETFGLTEEMIMALPENILDTLLSGEHTPVLPLTYNGVKVNSGKIRLFRTLTGEVTFKVLPELEFARMDMFDGEECERLLDGKVIEKDVPYPCYDEEGNEEMKEVHCFVQIDRQTYQIAYVPTPVIARNLKTLCEEYNIDSDMITPITEGDMLTVKKDGEDYTVGISLNTRSGVCVFKGTAEDFEYNVYKPIPQYTFGTHGAWVNTGEGLRYYKEEEFTEELKAIRDERRESNEFTDREYEEEERLRGMKMN